MKKPPMFCMCPSLCHDCALWAATRTMKEYKHQALIIFGAVFFAWCVITGAIISYAIR
jgi:hypothetical protein